MRSHATPDLRDRATIHAHELAAHLPVSRIAKAAGVAADTLHRILRAETPPQVTARTAEKILTVPIPESGETIHEQRMAAAEHARQLTRVMTQDAIATAAKISPDTVKRILENPALMTTQTAARIRAVKLAPTELTWGETRRRAASLWRSGMPADRIAAVMRIPEQRVRDALAGTGARTQAKGWPIAGHVTHGKSRGRAA